MEKSKAGMTTIVEASVKNSDTVRKLRDRFSKILRAKFAISDVSLSASFFEDDNDVSRNPMRVTMSEK